MLEFIVLGEVPGTNFVFTVKWALFGIALLLLYIHFELRRSRQTHNPKKQSAAR